MAIAGKLAQLNLDRALGGAPFVRVKASGPTDTSLDKSIFGGPAVFYGSDIVIPPPPPSGGVMQQSMFLSF
jgi:hypothetical protein